MSNRLCPKCGAMMEADDRFCTSCGTACEPQQAGVFCTRCGQQNEEGDRFCVACGSPLVQPFNSDPSEYDPPEPEKREKKPLFGRKSACGDEDDNIFRNDDTSPAAASFDSLGDGFGSLIDEGEERVDDREMSFGDTERVDDEGKFFDRDGDAVRVEDDDLQPPPQRPLYSDIAPGAESEPSRGGKTSRRADKSSGYSRSSRGNSKKRLIIGVCVGIVALLLVAAVVLFLVTANTGEPAETPTLPPIEPTVQPAVTEPVTTPEVTPEVTPEATPTANPNAVIAPVFTTPTVDPNAVFVPVITAEPTAPAQVVTAEPTATAQVPVAENGSDVVIILENANHRAGPGEDTLINTVVMAGEVLKYLGTSVADANGVNWYFVEYNGVEGWVSAQYAQLQPAAESTAEPAAQRFAE